MRRDPRRRRSQTRTAEVPLDPVALGLAFWLGLAVIGLGVVRLASAPLVSAPTPMVTVID